MSANSRTDVLPESISYAVVTFRIIPRYRTIETDNLAGAAFETARKFNDHFTGAFVERIEMTRANSDTPLFFACTAFSLIEGYVALPVVLYCVKGDLLFNLHLIFS
jgi:hypothetical protein